MWERARKMKKITQPVMYDRYSEKSDYVNNP